MGVGWWTAVTLNPLKPLWLDGKGLETIGMPQQQWLPNSVCNTVLPSRNQQSTQILDIWKTGYFLSTRLLQALCKMLQDQCTAACHVARDKEWIAATVLRAEINGNKLQFILQIFLWKLQTLSNLQNSKNHYIRQIWPVKSLSRWGNRFWMFPYSAIFPELLSSIMILFFFPP